MARIQDVLSKLLTEAIFLYPGADTVSPYRDANLAHYHIGFALKLNREHLGEPTPLELTDELNIVPRLSLDYELGLRQVNIVTFTHSYVSS